MFAVLGYAFTACEFHSHIQNENSSCKYLMVRERSWYLSPHEAEFPKVNYTCEIMILLPRIICM